MINSAQYGATEYDECSEMELLPEQRYRLRQPVWGSPAKSKRYMS
jgi:hypothetical protein